MTPKAKIWSIAFFILFAFHTAAWMLGSRLHLKGSDKWVLIIGLTLLGLIAAGLVLWWALRRHAAAAPPRGDAQVADIDATINAAKNHLAASRVAGRGALSRLPVVLVLGPTGSAKTTSVLRSGLEPELLAGAVQQGETVAPTPGVNLWYAQGTVLLEAGGALMTDPGRFGRAIRHILPRRLAAVFGRGAQAPRSAVVCVSCEELVRPGAGESAMVIARALRERLAEAAHALGIRLPVYVVFTKADRVPFFTDYAANFTGDEAREVLGSTLPADAGSTGLYGDRQAHRVGAALDRLFVSLADRRLVYLGRENASERKPGEYEFPRELRKAFPLASQFLVELCRPSQLQVSPFLRGIYFTGVRPVLVTDASSGAAEAGAGARAPSPVDATGVFSQAQLAQGARAAAAPMTRKVPQWMFLPRLFAEVFLGDKAAQRVTSTGARVNFLRRALVSAVGVAGVLYVLGLIVSFARNRALEQRTAADARAATAAAAGAGTSPSTPALQALDSLRADVQQLRDYDRDGAPLGLRFGLYRGDAMLPDARGVYFALFDKLLLASTRQAIVSALQALPGAPRPTDDYATNYSLLKAYLITTANADKSTEDFLAPVLLQAWSGAAAPDSNAARLAERQFAFYANELRIANPYVVPADPQVVAHARDFLQQFAGTEPIYQAMLAEASKGNPSIQFNRAVPGSVDYVVDRYEVPGAFTKGGYDAMQKVFANADRFFQGERWVLGGEPRSQMDKQKVLADLRARYQRDYIAAWTNYLQNASLARYGGVRDAANKLTQIAGNQSPVLKLLAIASDNTNLDTAGIGKAMQPVHVVVPPGQKDKLIGPALQSYMTALAQFQVSVGQVAGAPPGGADAQIQTANQNGGAASGEVQKLAQQFLVGNDASVSTNVQRLLLEPVRGLDPFLRNYGAGQLNAKGGGFCAQYGNTLRQFPFDPRALQPAGVAEVTEIFKPVTGKLWTLYNDALQNVIVQQGSDFVPKPGGTLTVSTPFLSFFNRAAAFSAAVFPSGAGSPHLTMLITPIQLPGTGTLQLSVDGNTVEWGSRMQEHSFTWTAGPTSEATIAVRRPSGLVTVATFHGPWSLFQLFDAAASWQPAGKNYRAEWVIPGSTERVQLQVDLGGAQPVLGKNYFSGFRCVGAVVR